MSAYDLTHTAVRLTGGFLEVPMDCTYCKQPTAFVRDQHVTHEDGVIEGVIELGCSSPACGKNQIIRIDGATIRPRVAPTVELAYGVRLIG